MRIYNVRKCGLYKVDDRLYFRPLITKYKHYDYWPCNFSKHFWVEKQVREITMRVQNFRLYAGTRSVTGKRLVREACKMKWWPHANRLPRVWEPWSRGNHWGIEMSLLRRQNAEQTKNTNMTNKSSGNVLKFKHAYMWTTQLGTWGVPSWSVCEIKGGWSSVVLLCFTELHPPFITQLGESRLFLGGFLIWRGALFHTRRCCALCLRM